MSPPIARRQKRLGFSPRVKVWLESDGGYAFGFGLSEILQAVEHAGSIKHAAADLGKSYRYVWGRIKKAEAFLGQSLVETQVGGKDSQRSSLTPEAVQLVANFQALRDRVIEVVQLEFTRFFSQPRRRTPS